MCGLQKKKKKKKEKKRKNSLRKISIDKCLLVLRINKERRSFLIKLSIYFSDEIYSVNQS
jgi:hypothetical protein